MSVHFTRSLVVMCGNAVWYDNFSNTLVWRSVFTARRYPYVYASWFQFREREVTGMRTVALITVFLWTVCRACLSLGIELTYCLLYFVTWKRRTQSVSHPEVCYYWPAGTKNLCWTKVHEKNDGSYELGPRKKWGHSDGTQDKASNRMLEDPRKHFQDTGPRGRDEQDIRLRERGKHKSVTDLRA